MGVSPQTNTNVISRNKIVEGHPIAALGLLHLLVLLSLALSALIWGATFIVGGQELQLQRYGLGCFAFYAVSSAAFIVARIEPDETNCNSL